MNLLHLFTVSFLLTLALEYPVVILSGSRDRKDLLLVLPVNLLTNPAVVALSLFLTFSLRLPALPVQICLEIPVILIEGLLYRSFGRDIRHPFILSLCANVFSYTMGLALQALL